MKQLNQYITEKFKISKNIKNINDEIYFLLPVGFPVGFNTNKRIVFDKKYLLCIDSNNTYVFIYSLEDLIDISKKEKIGAYFVRRLKNENYDKINDIKSEKIKIKKYETLCEPGDEEIENIIQNEKS